MYKAKSNDFLVIVDSAEAVAKYRKDSSTPLIDVVESFEIFVTNKHGSQGVLDRASKGQLENEFETYCRNLSPANGRTRVEEAIDKILREGKVEQTKTTQKFGMDRTAKSLLMIGSTNDAKFSSM